MFKWYIGISINHYSAETHQCCYHLIPISAFGTYGFTGVSRNLSSAGFHNGVWLYTCLFIDEDICTYYPCNNLPTLSKNS